MLSAILRWLGRNLSTLLLAFILALVVWVSAVLGADPIVESTYPFPVEIEVEGQDPDLVQIGSIPNNVLLTIRARQSIWNDLTNDPDQVRAWIDLTDLGPGEHVVEVRTQVEGGPNQVIRVEPEEVEVILEPLASQTFDVEPLVNGNPAIGYRKGEIRINPEQVTVSGPASLVRNVAQVRAPIDISGAIDTVSRPITVQPVDEDGNIVSGVTVSPQEVTVTQVVNLLGGYRNVVVKPVTTGSVADGYWLTNISVSPPNVTVFSANPEVVNNLPGYVETEAIDLTGLSDDTDIRADLNLPEGVTLVAEQSVLVRVGIAALEGSLTVTLTPEVTGLTPDLAAEFAPETVDVILSGPLPVLYNLSPVSLRMTIDLTGLEPGIYQVTPVVDLLPEQVQVESILPETLEVVIGPAPTPTATPSGVVTVIPAPTQVATPTPTAAP